MLLILDTPHLTLIFLGTVLGLALALVWLFCELEQRFGKRIAPNAMARFGYLPDVRRKRRSRRDER